jgi:hypothetical protein
VSPKSTKEDVVQAMDEFEDPQIYIARAKLWEERAADLPNSEERDAYLAIANGYAKLARIINARISSGK